MSMNSDPSANQVSNNHEEREQSQFKPQSDYSVYNAKDAYHDAKLDGQFKHWRIPKTIDLKFLLSYGSSGAVSMCTDSQISGDSKSVALKRIDLGISNPIILRRILRELRIERLLSHPNILSLNYVVLPEKISSMNDLYLEYDYFHTDIKSFIQKNMDGPINPDKKPQRVFGGDENLRFIFSQILVGLHYLHKSGVMHRDIKSSNILLNELHDVKIANFSQAKVGNPKLPTTLGEDPTTLYYRPPEALLTPLEPKDYQKLDVWCFGVIVLECFGSFYLRGNNEEDQVQRIHKIIGDIKDKSELGKKSQFYQKILDNMRQNGEFDNLRKVETGIDNMPEDLLKMLQQIFQYKPEDRPTIEDLLKSDYFMSDEDYQVLIEDELNTKIKPLDESEFEFDNKEFSVESIKAMIYEEALLYNFPASQLPKHLQNKCKYREVEQEE